MPSKLRLRYIFRPLIKIISKGLSKIGVTPNIATFLMLLCSTLSLLSLVFLKNLLYFAIFVFITGILDGCDGMIARLTNRSTKFGGFFDSFMDRLSEFNIFLALLIFCWNQLIFEIIDMKVIIFIIFFASLMISYSRTRAENFYKGDFDIGLMARSERLFFIFISSLFAYFYGLFNELLVLFMILVISTALYRSVKISKQIKKHIN